MKRLKSIDLIRGWCIFIMVFSHLMGWWMTPEVQWFPIFIAMCLNDIAAGGFLLIAGISAILLYRSRIAQAEIRENCSVNKVKKEYLIRALLILFVAIIYNCFVAIGTFDPLNIWKWFIPLTIAVSLLLIFPMINTSKSFRILVAIGVWVANYYIYSILAPSEGQMDINGVMFQALYHTTDLEPILSYFNFVLIGTVIGDVIFEIFQIEGEIERRKKLQTNLMIPSLVVGVIFTIFGLFFLFPNFLLHGSFSSLIYAMGILFLSLSILIVLEEYGTFESKKNYRFLWYMSYYSLTIYITHNTLYFLFSYQLDIPTFMCYFIVLMLIWTLLFRAIYNSKWRKSISLKYQIGRIATNIATKIEIKQQENR